MTDMKTLNARVLSNGMTRMEYFISQNSGQAAVEYEGDFRHIPNVSFGPSERQQYDVYMPTARGKYPLIVRVHGGGWFMGHRNDKNLARVLPFVDHGYVVITVGYRLADEAVFPGPVEDILNGLEHILAHAEEYDVDPTRVAITGGSSGTIEATLTALRRPDVIKAAFMEASILDFTRITDQFKQLGKTRSKRFSGEADDLSIEALFMGGTPAELPEQYAEARAKDHLPENCPAFLMMHGLSDTVTPFLQSVEFAEAVREKTGDGERAQVILLPETGHGYTKGWEDPELFEKKLAFLEKFL